MRIARALPCFAVALAATTGCSPASTYRYSALTPAARPLSWDGRTAKQGQLRVEGAIARTLVDTNLAPALHDTALHVPNATLEGAATLAIVPGLEIGARYAYASYAWSTISAVGTPPLPDHPSVSGFGPEIRVAIPLDHRKRFTFGFAGNLMNYQTPYAGWQRCPCPAGANVFVDTSTVGGNAAYSLVSQGTESHFVLNLGIYPSVNINEDGSAGHVFGGLSAHTGFKNDGFTNVSQSGSTIEDAGLVFFLGMGYGIEFAPVRLSAMIALPLTDEDSPVNYGLTAFLSVGVDLTLWEPEPKKRVWE